MEWRLAPDFPDYEVSEAGDVRRLRQARGGPAGKILKPYLRADGYPAYILRRDGRSVHRKAHQLVAVAFLGPRPFALAEVCHDDGCRANNHWRNLRWDTRKGNHADKVRHGTMPWGERHGAAKLTTEVIREIRALASAGELQRVIAARFGIRQGQVSRIANRQRWAHV